MGPSLLRQEIWSLGRSKLAQLIYIDVLQPKPCQHLQTPSDTRSCPQSFPKGTADEAARVAFAFKELNDNTSQLRPNHHVDWTLKPLIKAKKRIRTRMKKAKIKDLITMMNIQMKEMKDMVNVRLVKDTIHIILGVRHVIHNC